jgi:hypothetical protein
MPAPFVPAAGSTTIIGPGDICTVVNGAVGVGLAASFQFTVQPRYDGGDRDVIFQAIKTAITVLTADLLVSSDGGVTFAPLVAGIDFVTASGAQKPATTLMAGLIYQLNIKTFTGTSVVINAAVS